MPESVRELQNPRKRWGAALLVMLLIMAVYLLISSRSTLWDRDEPRFTRAAIEMVQSGKYLVPTFNGKVWPDKPPLLYWLMTVSARLFGPTEVAFRSLSVLGTGLACLLVFLVGRTLLNTKAALWAMVVLATTLLVMVVGSMATSDGVLLAINVAVMAVFWQGLISRFSILKAILIGILLGFGMLTKGPIGLMPVFAIVPVLWFTRKDAPGPWRRFSLLLLSLAIGFSIFAAWAGPANNATGGQFMRVFLGRHVITRAFSPLEHHGGNLLLYLPYYPIAILVAFFPWTLFLPGALSALLGGRIGGRYGRVFLLSWIVPALIIMTCAATKLPHYIIFIWPALALAVAGTITAWNQNKLADRDKRWLRAGVWFFAPLAAAEGFALMLGPRLVKFLPFHWSSLSAGLVLLIMAALAVHFQLVGRLQKSAVVLTAGMLLFLIPILFGVLPAVEKVKVTPAIAKAVNARTAPDVPVATYKFGEPTLNFYLGREIQSLPDEGAVVAWARRTSPGVLVIPADQLERITTSYGPLPVERIASKKGFNYSKGRPVELIALSVGKKQQ
jgi:4-amino-4-deoxy-L-arabinose transferase-like glycosyltransferase